MQCYIPSEVTTRLLARSALLPTKITAFCAIFSVVHNVCNILSANIKLPRSAEEYITQQPCGSQLDRQFSGCKNNKAGDFYEVLYMQCCKLDLIKAKNICTYIYQCYAQIVSFNALIYHQRDQLKVTITIYFCV